MSIFLKPVHVELERIWKNTPIGAVVQTDAGYYIKADNDWIPCHTALIYRTVFPLLAQYLSEYRPPEMSTVVIA